MPCDHKFLSELDLTHLDYEPDTLIVGTFNPAWPAANDAEWFYGRKVNNYFWDVLPRVYGHQSLMQATAAEWKQFCRDNKIAFTDLICRIDDADPGDAEQNKMLATYADKTLEYRFEDFEFIDVVKLLQRNPTIKNIYFTRGITDAFWRHLWNPALKYCAHNQLHERRLLSPTNDATYQQERYNSEYPAATIPQLEDYILMKWKEDWHC